MFSKNQTLKLLFKQIQKQTNIQLIQKQVYQFQKLQKFQPIFYNLNQIQQYKFCQNTEKSNQNQEKKATLQEIKELAILQSAFEKHYREDVNMQEIQTGEQMLQSLIKKKIQIYNSEEYQGWQDDIMMKIQYLFAKQETKKALDAIENLEKHFLSKETDTTLERVGIIKKTAIQLSVFVGLTEGIEQLQQGIKLLEQYKPTDETIKLEETAKIQKLLASLQEQNQSYEEAFISYENTGNTFNKLMKEAKNQEVYDIYAKEQASVYLQFAKLCQKLQFFEEGLTLLTAAFNLWHSMEGNKMVSIQYIRIAKQLGILFIEQGKYDQAFQYLTNCETALKEKNKGKNLADMDYEHSQLYSQVYVNLGKLYYMLQNFPKSMEMTKKAEGILTYHKIKYTYQAQIIEQKLTLYYMQNQTQEAMETVNKGLKLSKEHKKEQKDYFYFRFLYFKGLIHQSLSEFQQALETGEKLYEECQDFYKNINENEHFADGLRVRGHAKVNLYKGENFEENIHDLQLAANVYCAIPTKIMDYVYCLEDIIKYCEQYERYAIARETIDHLKTIKLEILKNLGSNEEVVKEQMQGIEEKMKELDTKLSKN